jgi:hypothetical protein
MLFLFQNRMISTPDDVQLGRYHEVPSHEAAFYHSWLTYFGMSEKTQAFVDKIILYRIPILIIISILVGIVFYRFANGWPLSTATFYAVNTLLGELFMVPGNKVPIADVFTVFYYIYGAFFLAGIIGRYVGFMVSNAPEIAANERLKLMEYPEEAVDADGDGYVGFWDRVNYWHIKILYKVGWEDHRSKYLTAISVFVWLIVGVLYGVVMESKSFGSALFFAISTIAGACYVGEPIEWNSRASYIFSSRIGPQCDNGDDMDCEIGMTREILLTVYVFIGYPLFTVLLGQFASLFIEQTVREHEKKILQSPLTEEEYHYAANLYGDDEVHTTTTTCHPIMFPYVYYS